MYGADGKTLELRPTEFKGMLRFWWRALHPDLSLKELKEKEREVFGSTERKSLFTIKISTIEQKVGKFYLLPHKNKAVFQVHEPGMRFQINLIFNKGVNEDTINAVKKLFIISTIVGGFGRRSRRGFGSIAIDNINGKKFDSNLYTDKRYILSSFKDINQNLQLDKDYGSVFPHIKEVYIANKSFNTYEALLRFIGEATSRCRCGKAGVFQNIKRFASPCYVSVIKTGFEYKAILTSLNIALPNNQQYNKRQIIKFKKSILEGEHRC